MNNAFSVPIYSLSESNPELISSLGAGKKGLFVLISDGDWAKFDAFIAKILKAIDFDIEKDVCIFPVSVGKTLAWSDLDGYPSWSHLWIAGEKLLSVNMDIQPYQWVSIHQKHIIFTHAIAQIESNASYKKLLWDALRMMFIE